MPGTIEPSKEKRHCGAEDCNEKLVGTSIGHHYRSKTDFDKLKVLRNLPRQLAEDELKNLDSHMAYMFRHNHSATNLPHWRTHKPVAKPIPSTFQRQQQQVCLLRRLPRKQHPLFQAVPKLANSVMYGGDCRDCRQHHEPTLGLQQVLFS